MNAHVYKCNDCSEISLRAARHDPEEDAKCRICGSTLLYVGETSITVRTGSA